MNPTPHRWTEAEISRLLDLRDRWHMSWSHIGARMGLTLNAVQSKYNAVKNRAAVTRDNGNLTRSSGAPKIDPAVIARQRDYQDAMQRRSLTQSLLGDPPPGYSALDRAREAEARS